MATFVFIITYFVPELFMLISDDGRTKPKPREGRPQPAEPTEHKCLIRVVLGNKKISTVVSD